MITVIEYPSKSLIFAILRRKNSWNFVYIQALQISFHFDDFPHTKFKIQIFLSVRKNSRCSKSSFFFFFQKFNFDFPWKLSIILGENVVVLDFLEKNCEKNQ